MKKVVAILLAVLMLCSVLPFAAFAEDEAAGDETAARVSAWEDNYGILLDTLTSNESYAHYRYVADNNDQLKKDMQIYTAFGLYEDAWANYFTNDVNKATCEKVLLAMIESYQYDMGKSYVDDLIKVLDTASDVNDFMQKLNGFVDDYSDVLDFVASDTWGEVFEIAGYINDAAKTWVTIRESLIDTYSQIISVQMANGYYINLLQYIADTTEYAPMKAAAESLIYQAQTAVEEQIDLFVKNAAADPARQGIDALVGLALNSNVYTATAKKIYNGAVSAADFLWNVKDLYGVADNLTAACYAEECVNAWAKEQLVKDDDYAADSAMFGIGALIAVRTFGEDAMDKYVQAKSDGVIGKIKSKINNTLCTEYTANEAALELMTEAFFNTDVADMAPVNAIDYIYCPVNVLIYSGSDLLFRVKDGEESKYSSAYGLAASKYCTYNKEYVKVAFLADAAYKAVMIGTTDGYVTFVKYIEEDGAINDYSFTEQLVAQGTKISVEGLKYAVTANNETTEYDLNDVFKVPEGKEVTVKVVVDATKDVVTDEANTLLAKIKAFFQKLFDSIKALFKIG